MKRFMTAKAHYEIHHEANTFFPAKRKEFEDKSISSKLNSERRRRKRAKQTHERGALNTKNEIWKIYNFGFVFSYKIGIKQYLYNFR